jgi:HEAT repeat protein
MGIFGSPNVGKMSEKHDVRGLIKALSYKKDAAVRKAASEALGELADPRAVEPLIGALWDEDAGVRVAAVQALGNMSDGRVTEPLIDALRDDDSRVAMAAAEALGGRADARAIEQLITALGHSPEVRESALAALVKIGAPAVVPLIEAYGYEKKAANEAIISALGRIGAARDRPGATHKATAALIERLEYTPKFREPFVKALVEIGEPAIEPLVAAVRHPARFCGAAEALKRLGWAPEDEDAWHWVGRGEYKKAISLGAPAVEPLIARLQRNDQPRRALEALVKIGEPAIQPLRASLGDGSGSVLAAEALGKLGDVEPLIAKLWGPEREAAVTALVGIGSPAVEPLIAGLRQHPNHAQALLGLSAQGFVRARRTYGTASVAEALSKLGWNPDHSEAGAWYWAAKGDYEKASALGAPSVNPLIAAWNNVNLWLGGYSEWDWDDDADERAARRDIVDQLRDEQRVIVEALHKVAQLHDEALTPAQRKSLEEWNAERERKGDET